MANFGVKCEFVILIGSSKQKRNKSNREKTFLRCLGLILSLRGGDKDMIQ